MPSASGVLIFRGLEVEYAPEGAAVIENLESGR